MLVKIFSLKFDALLGEFNDSMVQDFMQDKEVLKVKDHLLIRNEIPYLVLIIKYYPFRKEAENDSASSISKTGRDPAHDKGGGKNAWKAEISDAELPLFNRLRDWRSERCKKDGVPPYLIFTNLQLVAIVKILPQTLPELAQIEGVGTSKTEKYGADILGITTRTETASNPEEGGQKDG